MNKESEQLVIEQMREVQDKHPNLELFRDHSGVLWVRGVVGFSIRHDSHIIEDCYNLEVRIPKDYPSSPPIVFETEAKIPKEFGHFMKMGDFCLGAPVEVRRKFAQHKNLLCFIDEQVIPYLFAYSYKRDHGAVPFGERSHGSLGLIEYYVEFFGSSGIAAMKLLKCLADDTASPLMACPCGKGNKLKDCHGPKLDELRLFFPPKHFAAERQQMIALFRTNEKRRQKKFTRRGRR